MESGGTAVAPTGVPVVSSAPRSPGAFIGKRSGSGPGASVHAASVAWALQRRRARCAACSVAAQVPQPSAVQKVLRAARHVAEALPVQALLASEAAWKAAKEVAEKEEGAQRAKGRVRSSNAASLQPGTPVCGD